ncbi:MAG: carboxypeptidase regulatory-like domain-containing protein [Candidatus Binatia bacterium]
MIKKIKIAAVWLGFIGFLFLPFSAFAYEEVAVTNGGTIAGFVRFRGKAPELPPLRIVKAKKFCKRVPNETLVMGPGQGIRYAVVTLEGVARGKAVEREASHEMDNLSCRFVPHVQAAGVGQFLVLKNGDPILHTVHAVFQHGQPQFNVGLFPGRVTRKPLVSPGIVKIHCEVHPWMSAYIVVTDHPYHAVTDIYGEYLISNVPPGTYRLKVWHESLGVEEKRVEVKGGEKSKVDFTLSFPQGARR